MRVVVCSRYHHGEPAYAALDVAELLTRRGASVRLLATTSSGLLHPRWDCKAERKAFGEAYADAVHGADAIAWTHCPTADQVGVAKSAGAKSYYVHSWDEPTVEDAPALAKLDGILAPHRSSHAMLTNVCKLRAVVPCPWAPYPSAWVRDPVAPKSPRVVVWLDGPDQYNSSLAALDELPRLLDGAPKARVRVVAGGLRGPARRALGDLRDAYPGRLEVASPPGYDRLMELFLDCDLLVYPARFSGFAHAALWASAAAVPTVCFDCPPFGGIARLAQPACALPCAKALTEAGMAYVAEYAPGRLYEHAAAVLREGRCAVASSAHEHFAARRKTFENVMAKIFV